MSTQDNPQDEFSAAFDEFAQGNAPEEPAPAPAEPDPSPAPVEPSPAPVEPEPQEPAPAPQENWEQKYKSLMGKYNKEVQEVREQLKSTPPQDTQTPQEPAPQEPSPAPAEDPDVEARIQELMDELPHVGAAMKALLSKEIKSLRSDLDSQYQEKMRAIDPLIAQSQRSEYDRHIAAIGEKHNDWQNYVQNGELNAWVEAQPAYLQQSYQSVMQQGSTADVIDLLDRFKQSKGITQPAPSPTRSRVNDALAVRSRPSGSVPRGQIDKDDFEGAWEEFARLAQQK